ncbi:hypothetical protein GGI1_22294, partial [Acidithiobacillus sp. GGI-221]
TGISSIQCMEKDGFQHHIQHYRLILATFPDMLFAGHRTLDALREWFQGIENDIAEQRTTLAETLHMAGLSVSPAPTGHGPAEMKETRFGC